MIPVFEHAIKDVQKCIGIFMNALLGNQPTMIAKLDNFFKIIAKDFYTKAFFTGQFLPELKFQTSPGNFEKMIQALDPKILEGLFTKIHNQWLFPYKSHMEESFKLQTEDFSKFPLETLKVFDDLSRKLQILYLLELKSFP